MTHVASYMYNRVIIDLDSEPDRRWFGWLMQLYITGYNAPGSDTRVYDPGTYTRVYVPRCAYPGMYTRVYVPGYMHPGM